MKKQLILPLLVVMNVVAFAQEANLKIKFIAAKEKKVTVQLPVNGTTFYPSRKEMWFDKDSILILNFKVDKIANIYLGNSEKRFNFFIEPGHATIVFDFNKKGNEIIQYQGANEAGQALLRQKTYTFYQSRANKYYKADSTASGMMALLATDEQKELLPYDKLLQEGKITKTFYQLVKDNLASDYAAIAAHVPLMFYFATLKPGNKAVFKQEFKDLWAKVYQDYPVNSGNGLNAVDFYYYVQYYSNYYAGKYLPEKNGGTVKEIPANEDAYFKNSYAGFEKDLTGKVREYVLANFLFIELFQKKYQPVLVELFNKFKATYPKSAYSPYLQPMADEVLQFHQNAKQDFATDQKIMANYSQINSLDELMTKFKGKTVFVDLWATWCGPCKAEFEYGHELEKFLAAKGVEMLYISMDKDEADQQWKDMVKYYKLTGNHIRTNQALQTDLINKLWEGKGYAIPRYLILKDGKLVVASALRPSDKEKLYKQIEQYLD